MKFALLLVALVATVAVVQAQTPCQTISTVPATQYSSLQAFVRLVTQGCTSAPSAGCAVNVTGLYNDPITVSFFNGANPSYRNPLGCNIGATMPDYLTDAASETILVQHLAQFFGAALGCNVSATAGGAFPPYQGLNSHMFDVHSNMPIHQTQMTQFATYAVGAGAALGFPASSTLVTAVAGALATFGRTNAGGTGTNEICAASDCTCATGATCSAAVQQVQISFVVLAMAALASFLFGRQ